MGPLLALIGPFLNSLIQGVFNFLAQQQAAQQHDVDQKQLEALQIANQQLQEQAAQQAQRKAVEDEVSRLSDADLLSKLRG